MPSMFWVCALTVSANKILMARAACFRAPLFIPPVSLVLLSGALLSFAKKFLIGGNLLCRQNRFYAGGMLVLDLEHGGPIGIANGPVLRLGLVHDRFER